MSEQRGQTARESHHGTEKDRRLTERREVIARAACACIERKGVQRTSIADIAREIGITRELVYYYYPNKREVVKGALDIYVQDGAPPVEGEPRRVAAFEHETVWSGRLSALSGVMRALRVWLAEDSEGTVPMIEVLNEVSLWPQVMLRVASEAVAALAAGGWTNEVGTNSGEGLGRTLALVGAMDMMLCKPMVADDELVAGIMALFW